MSQELKLSKLLELGLSLQESALCLERAGYDVERAIELYFQSNKKEETLYVSQDKLEIKESTQLKNR